MYRNKTDNKTFSNQEPWVELCVFLPPAGPFSSLVLDPSLSQLRLTAFGSGPVSRSFAYYIQQSLQTWLRLQWISEKARIKHDKKFKK